MDTGMTQRPLDIAVVGSGIAGLSAAWLLSGRHKVTVYEAAGRLGGHSNTVDVELGGRSVPVDTGFIVFNAPAYPNLTRLFDHLGVETVPTDMSFAVSLDDGALEYAGTNLIGLFAQKRNLVSPRFWSMLRDTLRFYREAPRALSEMDGISLDSWLDRRGYGEAFREDHLYPMAAAIWSTPAAEVGAYPAAASCASAAITG
ncbi:protoporphyrinogen oxidase [Methylobrevis pamukkalensis]|uniref:Protoporphyrinogen oxidase n=1 Tax=Methylobrevis pamukkalensis TaxID=1439726 RepID=A0A1E3H6I7_9HYPH|nr:protoporphyrinogen oxidase [Methylobrevis pamukkalensis]